MPIGKSMLKIHAIAILFLMSTACASAPHTVIDAAAPSLKNEIIIFDGGNYMIAPSEPASNPEPAAGDRP